MKKMAALLFFLALSTSLLAVSSFAAQTIVCGESDTEVNQKITAIRQAGHAVSGISELQVAVSSAAPSVAGSGGSYHSFETREVKTVALICVKATHQ